MRLGLCLPSFTADPSLPLAAAAASLSHGYDGVFSVDHLFPPGSPERPALEPFALLAGAAAAAPGLHVGVLSTRPGLRSAGVLAKDAAALDHLSRGRAILGLGIGDAAARREHETLGIPFLPAGERVELLERTAGSLRELFAGRRAPGGPGVPAIEGPLLPPGRPQVWLAGTGQRIVGAAARAADGWNGCGLSAEGFVARAAALRVAAGSAGRDPAEVPPTWGGVILVGRDAAELRRLEEDRDAHDPRWAAWRGTVDDLRRFADDLDAAGCAWFVCAAAGPDDRAGLIAATLAER